MDSEHHQAAQQFRELNETAGLEQTLNNAVAALSRAEIPHLVTGGYAAQEYGCLRYTDNIDFIVPDVARAFASPSEIPVNVVTFVKASGQEWSLAGGLACAKKCRSSCCVFPQAWHDICVGLICIPALH
jgi:hypothetical protein